MDKDKQKKLEDAGWKVGSADDLLNRTTENGSHLLREPFASQRYNIKIKRKGRFLENYYVWFDKRVGSPQVNVLDGYRVHGDEETYVLLELHELEKDNPKYKRVYRQGE